MHRRRFLGLTACATGLAGCLDTGDEGVNEERSSFLSFGRMDNFSGTVRLVPSCRDEAVEISFADGQRDKEIPYARKEDGEECSFEVFVDDEHVRSVRVGGTENAEINIDENGEIFFEHEQL